MKIRLYINADFTDAIALDAKQINYLKNVLRLQAGKQVFIFNGRDGEYSATITDLHKKHGTIQPTKQIRPQAITPYKALFFAPIKPQRLEFMLEKCTELGVTDFYPVITEYTSIRKINQRRLLDICIEAAEQCECINIPTIHDLQKLNKAILCHNDTIAFCDEAGADAKLKDINTNSILIGPEGGFSKTERDWLTNQPNITPVTLGNNILRAETAAIVACGICQ